MLLNIGADRTLLSLGMYLIATSFHHFEFVIILYTQHTSIKLLRSFKSHLNSHETKSKQIVMKVPNLSSFINQIKTNSHESAKSQFIHKPNQNK